jgi:formylglycine-generating enzyme required for sulfatase activity
MKQRITANKPWGLFVLLAVLVMGACENPVNDGSNFTAVADVTGVPAAGTTESSLTLTGTVEPDNATNNTIVWSVKDAGTTGAAINGSALATPNAGTVVVTATIANGLAEGTAYTKDFSITIYAGFMPVSAITGVPTSGTVGSPLSLTGTVEPENATSKTIAWSVKDAGTTGAAIIDGNTLSATDSGIVTVTATIANGLAQGTAYTQDYTISFGIVLPAYTLVSVPAGTVNVDVDYDGASVTGNGTGLFANAAAEPVSVPAFKIGETELTWELWKAVYDWAVDSDRGARQYTFANPGKQGGSAASTFTGTPQHPVTSTTWRDIVVWCNAYSEASGKAPVYYQAETTDFTDTSAVLRISEATTTPAGNGEADNAVINPNANGFRLPTITQWEYAARGAAPSSNPPWTYKYAGTDTTGTETGQLGDYAWYTRNSTVNTVKSTQPVKTKLPNSLGLYDMSGNVLEWCWDNNPNPTGSSPATNRAVSGGGGSFYSGDPAIGVVNYISPAYSPSLMRGFRIVAP